jgi:hypothetical protein
MPGARLYNSMECLILIAVLSICNLNCLDFSKDMKKFGLLCMAGKYDNASQKYVYIYRNMYTASL